MDDKARIVAETLEPNAIISEVARRYGFRPQQVFAWRREARKQAASVQQESPAFVPAVVMVPPPEPAPRRRRQDGYGGDPCAEGNVVIGPMGAVKVMVATKPVNFRKGAEGLAALVRDTMGADPFSGAVYVFRAKRTDRIKLIFWDGTGVCLYAKRLEDGEFRWPKVQDGVMRLTAAQLSALLEGLDWRRVHESRQTSVPAQAG
jgi:transposase